MLDNKSIVLFTICINYVSTEYKIYSDGWVPVPRELIYNQLRKEASPDFVDPDLVSTTKDLNSIKIFQSQINSSEKIKVQENVKKNNLNIKIPKQINFPYEIDKDISTSNNVKESARKAKNVANSVFENNFGTYVNKQIIQKDEIEDNIEKAGSAITDRTIIYEVTEDTDDIKDFKQNNSNDGKDLTSIVTDNQNFGSNLINILSKYNIKNDDKLKNYDMSRLFKHQNPVRKYQYGYNSLNHLPVDPLLAVFLSNYGWYIPSLYGINTNYNNLYGYLASNNIHNNRPFGLYKVFSDTDSWN